MKRNVLIGAGAICLILLAFVFCCHERSGVSTDHPPAIMVDGEVYVLDPGPIPGEVDDSAILGYTTSYTDAMPSQNGETNFDKALDMPYAKVSGGIAVLYHNEWRLCTLMK